MQLTYQELEGLERESAILDATIDAVMTGARPYSIEHMAPRYQNARMGANIPGTTAEYFRSLIIGLEKEFSWDAIVGWLQQCDSAGAVSEVRAQGSPLPKDDHRALLELTAEQVQRHRVDPCFVPQPAVEESIGKLVIDMRNLLQKTSAYKYSNADDVARITLGSAAAVYHCLGKRWSDYRNRPAFTEYGMVAECFNDVRRAIVVTFMQCCLPSCAGRADFLPTYSAKLQQGLAALQQQMTPALYNGGDMRMIYQYLEELAAFRNASEQIQAAYNQRATCGSLAQLLEKDASPHEAVQGVEPFMIPHGSVTLVRRLDAEGKNVLSYTVDGPKHCRSLLVADSQPQVSQTPSAAKEDATPKLVTTHVASCAIDDRGKVYFTSVGRVAPVVRNPEYNTLCAAVQRVRTGEEERLHSLRRRHELLFEFADILAPSAFCILNEGNVAFVCPASAAWMARELTGHSPLAPEVSTAILQSLGIRAEGSFTCFPIEGPITSSVVGDVHEKDGEFGEEEGEEETNGEEDASGAPVPLSRGRRYWRKVLRNHAGKKVKNLQAFLALLKPLGEVHETHEGRGHSAGSHGRIVLDGPDGKRRQTVSWYKIRGTTSLGWNIAHMLLDEMQVTEQELCEGHGWGVRGEENGAARNSDTILT